MSYYSASLSKASRPASHDVHGANLRPSGSLPDKDSKELLVLFKAFLDSTSNNSPAQKRAIRLPEVLNLLGIGKSTWYERLNRNSPNYDPSAPKPFKLGCSARSPSVWWYSEIQAYLSMRASVSRSAANEVRA